ncbi:MAG: threonine ammonia-lyase [Tepidimonas sp.]|nr:threonine ammonia-lyase [Tepidimonas sp.]
MITVCWLTGCPQGPCARWPQAPIRGAAAQWCRLAASGAAPHEEQTMIGLAEVQQAAQRLAGQVLQTPCLESRTLSQITGAQVFLKFENLQYTASFKERGACNKLALLKPEERARGVVAMSAGNHAQGVAYHAQRWGVRAVIVMPRFTPGIKVERTRALGAEVVLHGETLEQAREHADALAHQQGLTFVHPYDDDAVIAGQGTVALEMLQAQPDLQALVVAAGGGGLIGGMAVAAKALKPDIEVIGVQTRRFAAMVNALTGSHWPQGTNTIAEGIAVGQPGQRTLALARRYVDDWLVVDEEDLEQAIVLLLDIEKTLVEGAGAAGLAALLKYPQRLAGRRVGLVLCGGNLDPLLLASIIERGMVRAGRLVRLVVSTRDLPGQLARIAGVVAEAGANIDQVHHQRAFTLLAAQNVEIELVLQTRGPQHVQEVLAALRAAGFEVTQR